MIAFEQDHVRDAMRRAEMHVQRRPVRQCAAVRQPAQLHIEPRARHERARIGQPVAARQRRLVDARQIQGAALARPPDSGVAILCVNAAHPHLRAGRHHGERVADLHTARDAPYRSPPCRVPAA